MVATVAAIVAVWNAARLRNARPRHRPGDAAHDRANRTRDDSAGHDADARAAGALARGGA
jgi:hypothetical protein